DKLVGQVTDPEYTDGEVGFYVETFDATNVHIHFDKLTIRNFELSIVCNISAGTTLNVRSGPSTRFSSFTFLSNGDTIEPVGRSADGNWIKVNIKGNTNPGWVFYSPEFVSCNASVDLLPVIKP
ncbi:MAG TPA: SH3 domain-containing protein, partial [Anaerolineales bacterium]|nr:SH3 domain-containing protein [Anaerolineales bacterium]